MRFYPLEKLINLHDNYTRQFKIDALQLLLLQRQGEVYLIEASCPHQGHPLEAAAIGGGTLVCPLHQYQFALDGGRLLYASRVMYSTLVYTTGAVPSEYYSVQKRPAYSEYQERTNRFFPGPPRLSK